MRRVGWGTVVCLLVLSAVPGAAEEEARESYGPTTPDAMAPAGCWYMEDGCASRSGATRTPDLARSTKRIWSFEAPDGAVIDEEPRVWRGIVVLPLRHGASGRSLQVLQAHDGRPYVPAVRFATSMPLRPCLGDAGILVRAGERTLALCRVRGGSLVRVWTLQTPDPVHDLLLYDDAVYARVGTDLFSWAAKDGTQRWHRPGSFRGRLSLAGQDLFVLEYDEAGNSNLALIDAWTGGRGLRLGGGVHTDRGAPAPSYGARIVVLPENVFVCHDLPLRTSDGQSRTLQWFRRTAGASGRSYVDGGGLFDWHQVPVLAGRGWLTVERQPSLGMRLRLYRPEGRDTVRGPVLATEQENAHFLAREVPYTLAGRCLIVGGQAFDVDTQRVLWETKIRPAFRPVPTRDAILVAPDTGRLDAFAAPTPSLRGELFFGEVDRPASKLEGRLLLADDRVRQGSLEIDVEARTVRVPVSRKKTSTVSLDDVRVILDADGHVLYTHSVQDTEAAVARLFFFAQASAYQKLAKDAYKAYDADVMRRMIDAALVRGIPPKALKHQEKQQQALVDRSRKANASRLEKILAREETLLREVSDGLARATELFLQDPRPAVRRAFVEQMLRERPDHPGATAIVRRRIPDYVKAPEALDARAWLGVCDVLDRIAIHPVEVRDVPPVELSPGERELAAARHYWRPDLVGLQSDQLLIMTSLERPRSLAVCLAMGEMVCDALEAIFREGEGRRETRYPLVLQLCGSREEYKKLRIGASRDERRTRKRREWSAGHFDANAGVSRIWLGDHPDAFDDVRETYAHELTHHWMRERCPLYDAREIRRKERMGGYWLVEGIAVFLEQFRWDLEAGTWDAFHPRAPSLEAVAQAGAGVLVPWPRLFAVSGRTFDALKGDAKSRVPQRWRLGWYTQLSERGAFYAQAGAVVSYLYHHDAETRRALFAYARDVYTGSLPKPDGAIRSYFGVEPAELGRRVTAYARDVLAGRVRANQPSEAAR